MAAVHLSESEILDTRHGKQCLNSTAGRPMYILKMQQMERAVIIQTEFDWILLTIISYNSQHNQ